VTTSGDGFCGSVGGYGQVFGVEPSDRIRLEGSTFGAARVTGDALPTPVTACALQRAVVAEATGERHRFAGRSNHWPVRSD
jgi:hypothetical protein